MALTKPVPDVFYYMHTKKQVFASFSTHIENVSKECFTLSGGVKITDIYQEAHYLILTIKDNISQTHVLTYNPMNSACIDKIRSGDGT